MKVLPMRKREIKQLTENDLTQLIKHLNLDELDMDSSLEETGEYLDIVNDNPLKQPGWIQVKDQAIIVQDPVNGGSLPVISAIAPVKLFVNDEAVETERSVCSTDRIRWEIDEKPLYDIIASEDGLLAFFHLHSKERYAWRLSDVEPQSRIIITAEEDKNIVLETVDLGDVAAMIEQKSIKANLDLPAVMAELVQPTYLSVRIARGKAAVAGKDAQLKLYFSEEVENQFNEIEGSVDFRNHLRIPSAKTGDIIARKIPLEDGLPGYDVYGNVIMPDPPKDILIVAKPNVELTAAGEIIARKEGRPRLTGTKIKTFDISTSFVVSGNVDIETGNIVFSGDVIVYGNVTDNMIVESLGNIYVFGSVFNATLTATGSIHIRGHVIGSKLYSGYFGVMFNRLYNSSKMLSGHMEKLLAGARMLEQALESRKQAVRFGQIVLLLLENKLKEIPAAVKELLFVISNIQHVKKEEYPKLKEMSEIFFQPTKLVELVSRGFIQSYLALLQETHQEVARMQEETARIVINQCHNSELKSNGDIVIQREGVLLSDLYSAGNIVFKYESAVCRGSRLEADKAISAKIVGGQTSANTVLKAKRQVIVRKMYSGRVCVGKYYSDIFDLVENRTFDGSSLRRQRA